MRSDILQNAVNDLFQAEGIRFIEPIFCGIPLSQQLNGFSEGAAVIRGDFEKGTQFYSDNSDFRVNAIPINGIPERTYFRNIQQTGIEAVSTSILIALLPATLSFYFPIWSRELFPIHKEKITCQVKKGQGDFVICNQYPPFL